MRDLAILLAAVVGVCIGIALQPTAVDALNMADDLAFCKADLASLQDQSPTLERRTKERDRAIAEAEDWHGYYETVRKENAELRSRLDAERSLSSQIRMAYEATKQDLSSARYMLAKTAAVEAPPKKKKKTIKPKRKAKTTKAVLRKKIYRPWTW